MMQRAENRSPIKVEELFCLTLPLTSDQLRSDFIVFSLKLVFKKKTVS